MSSRRPIGTVLAVIALLVVFVGLPLLASAARVWTDYLWFVDLGHSDVFWTRLQSRLAVGAVFALASFAIIYANLRIARALTPRVVPVGLPSGMPPQWEQLYEQLRAVRGRVLDWVVLGGALFLAVLDGLTLSTQWTTLRLALARVPFGVDDPQFGQDVGFYVFTLPAFEVIANWLWGLLILVTVLTAAVYFIGGGIQPWARFRGIAPHVKAHMSVLFAALVLSRAFSYWLDVWNLNFSARGQVVGASYTDVHAQLPAYRILILISVVTAVLLLLNIRYRGWRLPAVALGVWLVAQLALAGVWPTVVQRFVVAPNEAAREAAYMERNIDMTRRAFQLSDIQGQRFPAVDDLTAQDVLDASDTISNVRLWDPDIAQQGYAQLQSIRPYYEFADVDVDRYEIDGQRRQVLVSAREMNSTMLAEQAQTWVNRHLIYTHGFGLVMSPTSEADGRGLPRFIIGDVPPRVASGVSTETAQALEVTEPRIYFGERTTEYVIVGADIEEFDYPLGETNAMYRYEGESGIEIGSLPRRLAWTLRLGATQVLFSDYVKSDSRVLQYRDLTTRIGMLAPWLSLEGDPYPVLAEGRIVWVVDAYTSSRQYPYANGLPDGTNYLRNSVKITVDAFTGEVTFYGIEDDPILQAWSSIFPDLITSGDEVPDVIRDHFRYPEGLFAAQAEIYRTYHMTDVGVFYNKEDQWELPEVGGGRTMDPFFVLLSLPGSDREHFYLMQPYTPRNRNNMIGWIATSSDPENYGERTVYQFPKERVIFGPEQVTARINQDSVISPQLSLWSQRGSNVLFGNMLVIPIRDSIVYIQPIFLQAEGTAIPELARVIVAYGDRVVMERTLEAALLQVFGEVPPGEEPVGENGVETPDAAEARRLYEAALEAQRAGDWAEYGRQIEELGRVLEQIAGEETTPTP
jgi:uncharacterized protein